MNARCLEESESAQRNPEKSSMHGHGWAISITPDDTWADYTECRRSDVHSLRYTTYLILLFVYSSASTSSQFHVLLLICCTPVRCFTWRAFFEILCVDAPPRWLWKTQVGSFFCESFRECVATQNRRQNPVHLTRFKLKLERITSTWIAYKTIKTMAKRELWH